ncbi:glycosyltransferase family protein [Flavobacterium chungangense]|uniref:glycosyltransferase family protein n=2 Tax=Flavobacterium chungangense TaxID=554283 RepID=UPI0004DF4402|nr:glycosyltransferase [Flavobacterium chungangense]
MNILLVGEYSLLHNSLKSALIELGHNVTLIGNSNGYRSYPVDYDHEAKFLTKKIFIIPRKIFFRLFKFELLGIEYGIRFYLHLSKLKNFDVVQFVNEAPIKTSKSLEYFFIRKIFNSNKKCFVLSAGIDYLTLKFYMENKNYKSLMIPFFQNPKLKEHLQFFDYFSKDHIKIHNFITTNFNGLIPTDFDYVEANRNSPIYKGFIPYPVNIKKLKFEKLFIENKIVIFLGIGRYSYHQKGIIYFEKALELIKKKYAERVEIIIVNTIPYPEYINLYNKSHILLDQCTSRDQGYNALEAMAKGKVVFTGAETEFTQYYNLSERVCVNAIPNVDYLVNELSFLIENPQEIVAMGIRARSFVEKEHDYIKIAQKYLKIWENN